MRAYPRLLSQSCGFWFVRCFFITVFLACFGLPVHATDLQIITNKGYVGFSVDDKWRVLGMQSKLPMAIALFQILNPADSGTPDSTNLSINLYDPSSPKAKAALDLIGKKYGNSEVSERTEDGWMIFTQHAFQKATEYTIIDAKKTVADVVVGVRLAWPHLKNNPGRLR